MISDVIAMHSNVAYYLRTVGALTFSTSALSTGGDITWGGGGIGLQSTEVAFFMGFRVIVDDMLKPTINAGGADQYPVYLMGPVQLLRVCSVLSSRKPTATSLSKQDVMSWTHDYGFHVFGTSWKAATDNPTNTLLETGGNWECVYGALTPATKATAPSSSPWPSSSSTHHLLPTSDLVLPR